jgi:hypothetical protein
VGELDVRTAEKQRPEHPSAAAAVGIEQFVVENCLAARGGNGGLMTPRVLAVGFAAPWLLWGLLFAAAPVIIHLLFRRRHRETRWAAMQFLAAAVRQQHRWMRIEEWLLMAMRAAILLLAALALAGPVWSLPELHSGRVPVQRIVVLDASLSTQLQWDGRSCWERAREAALRLLESARPGDTWQLVRLAGSPPFVLVAEPTVRVAPVLEELRSLTPTEERAAVIPALEAVGGLLSAAPSQLRKEVYIFTDSQRTNWRPVAEAERQAIRTGLQGVAERAKLVWWEASGPRHNTAVTDLQILDDYLFVGDALQATATVKRFGTEPVAGHRLDWFVNGRLTASQTVNLAPGEERSQTFRTTITAPDELRVEVRLAADALPADDRRFAVAVVRSVVKVLLVDGRPSGVPYENATDLLRVALSPAVSGPRSPGEPPRRIQPRVISDGELLSTRLDDYEVVFLCDVPLLTERDAEVLRQYVAQGGAVVVCLGPQVRAAAYNHAAWRDGQDWLPARLQDVMGDPRRRERAFAFLGGEFEHPILSPYRGNPNTGFELTQTFAYYRCQPAPQRSRVVLRFDTGDPAMVEAPYRRGRVVLVTTAVDRSWGTWAVWGHSFVPIMHETVKYLVSFEAQSRQGVVGEPIVTSSSTTGVESLVLRRPHDKTETIRMTLADGLPTWEYAGTHQAGFYGLELPGAAPQIKWYARNVDPRESDPATVTLAELKDEFLAGFDVAFDVPEEPSSDIAARALTDESGSTAGRWLLAAALVFLIGEPFFGWNRQLGLAAICGLTLAALAGFWGGAWAAIAVVLGEAAAAGWWFRRHRWTASE